MAEVLHTHSGQWTADENIVMFFFSPVDKLSCARECKYLSTLSGCAVPVIHVIFVVALDKT